MRWLRRALLALLLLLALAASAGWLALRGSLARIDGEAPWPASPHPSRWSATHWARSLSRPPTAAIWRAPWATPTRRSAISRWT